MGGDDWINKAGLHLVGGQGNDSASSATPAAENAREVRTQARNVRSLARLKRGSGSSPTP